MKRSNSYRSPYYINMHQIKRDCPMLKGHLPELLVPLRCLEVFCCNQLEAYTITTLQVQLRDYGKLQLDGTTINFSIQSR